MKRFLATSQQLFRASYYNAIIVCVRIVKGIVVSKVLAHFLGPNGFALLGNLKNFTQILTGFSAESYQNATIRYTSEYKEQEERLNKFYATTFQLCLGVAFITSIIVFIFSKAISRALFRTYDYQNIMQILAFALPFMSLNFVIIYILNGLENYKKLTLVNLSLSLINLFITVLLVWYSNLVGALVAVSVGPLLVFLLNLFLLGNDRVILLNIFNTNLFTLSILKNINKYIIMALYSTVLVSITYLGIRNMIINKYSLEFAGYWDAMNRISGFYTMFFISLTSFYLLPRLSKIKALNLFKLEMRKFYSLVIPIIIPCFFIIYILRNFILELFLNDKFLPVETLFFWRLIGDFISIISIALVKQFHAKLMVKAYLICNGMQYAMYFGFSYLFIDNQGIVGVMKAYTISYAIYFLLVLMFLYYYFKTKRHVLV